MDKRSNAKPPPPQFGNKNGIILKDPNIRQIAYQDFCNHIAEGFPLEAWSFNQDGFRCHWQTMLSYIKNDSIGEFDPFLKEAAHAKAYKKIYSQGISLMVGEIKYGSPMVWQVVMRNMFRRVGWDSDQTTQDNKNHVERLADSIRSEFIAEAKEGNSDIEQAD